MKRETIDKAHAIAFYRIMVRLNDEGRRLYREGDYAAGAMVMRMVGRIQYEFFQSTCMGDLKV